MKFKIQNSKFKISIQKSKLFKTFYFLIVFLTFNFLLFTLPSPAHAEVKIGDYFGFGDIKSLAQGTDKLIGPAFSVATVLVVFYFLFGAFKYLKSAGNKEEVEGARQMITHAIIGFILLIFAFLVLQFIPQFFNLPGLDVIK